MEKADEANGKCHHNNDCNFKPPRGSQFFYPDQQSKTHGRKPKAEFPKRHVNNSKRIAYSTPGPRLVFPSVSGAGAASGKTPEARLGDTSLGKGPAPARSCSRVLRLGLRKGRERPRGTGLQTPRGVGSASHPRNPSLLARGTAHDKCPMRSSGGLRHLPPPERLLCTRRMARLLLQSCLRAEKMKTEMAFGRTSILHDIRETEWRAGQGKRAVCVAGDLQNACTE